MSSTSSSLPETHTALILDAVTNPPSLAANSVPVPTLLPGSAIIRILSTPILAYAGKLYSGALPYPLNPPQTIGGGAIGRVVAVADDATSLSPGQLVLVDPMVRGRDDPTKSILVGVHAGISAAAGRLMQGDKAWRDGSAAEYARWPLENVHVLDEGMLKALGLGKPSELAYLGRLLVPMGGMVALDVRAGDRVVVAPATGQFGGAAVEVALAMGADVVICGRRAHALERMRDILAPVYPAAKIDVVQLSGTVETDAAALKACGNIDAYIDFSPAAAAASGSGGATHITSCIMALRKGGKACFMGGISQAVPIPYGLVMFNDLTICGKFMYEREGVKKLISLVENGRLRFTLPDMKAFGLKDWEEGFKVAEERSGWREMVAFEPGRE